MLNKIKKILQIISKSKILMNVDNFCYVCVRLKFTSVVLVVCAV